MIVKKIITVPCSVRSIAYHCGGIRPSVHPSHLPRSTWLRRIGRVTTVMSTPDSISDAIEGEAIADAALSGHSEAYRHLDTGVLETLLLKGALGLSDDDISHFNGMFYARDTAEALAKVRSGEYDAAFLMRPTPIGQVRDVAAEGENMPPKSTYFFPKLLTGLLFNPLA